MTQQAHNDENLLHTIPYENDIGDKRKLSIHAWETMFQQNKAKNRIETFSFQKAFGYL